MSYTLSSIDNFICASFTAAFDQSMTLRPGSAHGFSSELKLDDGLKQLMMTSCSRQLRPPPLPFSADSPCRSRQPHHHRPPLYYRLVCLHLSSCLALFCRHDVLDTQSIISARAHRHTARTDSISTLGTIPLKQQQAIHHQL